MTFNTSNMIQELGKSILEVQTRFKNILINIFCRPPESALSARLSSRHILINLVSPVHFGAKYYFTRYKHAPL